ncbi:MerR family transcriptional regulator [Christensenellaceae bacterium OttesenSCG-928-M15]|nr:MerR family transcriptional regulator [Christensenellaceae bacterium OttesenSCG-928-M15]
MEYSIREIARLFGNTVGAIRFYEGEGLINPARDASGNRVYTDKNIFELFYLRKYCTFGLKIKEVAEYFHYQSENQVDGVCELLNEKRLEAQRLMRYYERSAKWIESYHRLLEKLDELVNGYELLEAPAYYAIVGEDFLTKNRAKQAIAQKWIAAAPLSRISYLKTYRDGALQNAERLLIIKKESAQEMELPVPDYVQTLLPCRCLHTVLRSETGNFEAVDPKKYREKLEMAGANAFQHSNITIENMLFTHKVEGRQIQFFEMFIPLDMPGGILTK